MSSNNTYDPPGGPEYLGPQDPAPGSGATGSGKKWALLGASAVAVIGVVGAGGWAALQLMSGGTSASSAIPANAVGYVSLDLDPSAGQKIEAIKILKKFPGIDKQLDLGIKDDLRRWVFTKIQEDGTCDKVDYAKDIEPWIGDRVALAAVPSPSDNVTPVVAVQVTDEDAARKGVKRLEDACDGAQEATGIAFAGDYLLVSDSQQHAEDLAGAAQQSSLEDDADFQNWMNKVGDPGVVTMYAAPDAPAVIAELQNSPGHGMDSSSGALAKDFKGMAGVVRFRDGGVEAEFVGQVLPASLTPEGGQPGPDVATLPATTGAVLALAFRDGWLGDALDSMSETFGDGMSVDDMLAEAEAETGLQLPEDLETLLGDGVSLSVDSSADFGSLMSEGDPSQLPVGLRIKGDPDAIIAVVDKIKASLGPEADSLVVQATDDTVALGLSQDYVTKLIERGKLGDEESFKAVVPDADEASAVLYLSFDAGDGWAERLAGTLSDDDREVTENVAPLDALGFSLWADSDKVQHAMLRLATD